MWRHRLLVVLLLTASWACFAFLANELDNRIHEDCQKFHDLSAECYAPAALIIAVVSAVFVVVTLVQAWLARPRRD
jgi:hypothetical protein